MKAHYYNNDDILYGCDYDSLMVSRQLQTNESPCIRRIVRLDRGLKTHIRKQWRKIQGISASCRNRIMPSIAHVCNSDVETTDTERIAAEVRRRTLPLKYRKYARRLIL